MTVASAVYPPQGFGSGGGAGATSSGGSGAVQVSDGAGGFSNDTDFTYISDRLTVGSGGIGPSVDATTDMTFPGSGVFRFSQSGTDRIEFRSTSGTFGNNGIIINSELDNTSLEIREFSTAPNPKIEIVGSRGTQASVAPLQSGDRLASYVFSGNNATGGAFSSRISGAEIRGVANENWGASNFGTRIEIRTSSDGAGGQALSATFEADGRFTTKDGSTTEPSWSFDSDFSSSTKGIYRLDANTFGVGYERLRLQSEGTNTLRSNIDCAMYGNPGGAATFTLTRSRGTIASPTNVLSGDQIGRIFFNGNTNAAGYSEVVSAQITCTAEENFTASAFGTRLEFSTVPVGSTVLTNAMTLEESGQVTIEVASLRFWVTNDAGRPAAGVQGRVFFNSDDGNLNIDDGTNWILPDGTIT